ncbi:MAG: hypothetical protein Q4F95_05610 [Oscillospiraceae bacterium]|nr:hypothetical protein [Oscillospiraceae bacterium]
MTGVRADLNNKSSYDNYIFYRVIRKKVKLFRGIFVLSELYFIFQAFSFYWIGICNIIMPALILIIIKDIYLIIVHDIRKSVISAAVNATAVMIMTLQYLFNTRLGIGELLIFIFLELFLLPSLSAHIILFRYECIEQSLSSLADYPYFFSYNSGPDNKQEFAEFGSGTGDKLLKNAVKNHNISKQIRFIRLACVIGISTGIILCLYYTARLSSVRNTQKYSPLSQYSYTDEPYINIDLSLAWCEDCVKGNASCEFWALPSGCDKHVYLISDKQTFDMLTYAQFPVNLKGKIVKADENEISNAALSKELLNERYAFLGEKSKDYLDSITRRDIFIQIINTDKTSDQILYSFLLILISFAVLIFTDTFIIRKYHTDNF